jgi:hypothetical protein
VRQDAARGVSTNGRTLDFSRSAKRVEMWSGRRESNPRCQLGKLT